MRHVNAFGMLMTLLVGCTSFSGDASPDPSPPGDAGGNAEQDGSSTPVGGQGAVAPGPPAGVTPTAIPVVTTVTTLAGSGAAGSADGTGSAATFNHPEGVALDGAGNLYVADTTNHTIRKVTPAGVVTTFAGSGASAFADGVGTAASFSTVTSVAVDNTGNVFVADYLNQRIRKVTAAGVVTTVAGSGTGTYADGTGIAASFRGPTGVALDSAGNIYVADAGNFRIRKVNSSNEVTTFAGSGTSGLADGTGAAAQFYVPNEVAVDSAGNLYVADNFRVRKVTSSAVVTTLAGSDTAGTANGTGAAASFKNIIGIAADAAGNVYLSDAGTGSFTVRRVTQAGVVTTLAGSATAGFSDGIGTSATFGGTYQLAVDPSGVVYAADGFSHAIRKLTSVGIGQLAVTWTAPTSSGTSKITSYKAVANAAGQPVKDCTTTGVTSCTISGLTTGISYAVSVTATSDAGESPPSGSGSATPN